ncbi:hypothetical protein V8B97DRAFT_2058722 [Scleroderma yunnanense]
MSSLKNAWTSRFHQRTGSLKAQAAPLIPSKGHRAQLSSASFATPVVDERDEDERDVHLAPLHEESERDLADVQRASTVLLAPNTSKLQSRRPSHSDMESRSTVDAEAKDSLPAPVIQSKSTGSDAPESVNMNNIKRFLMQEIDGSLAAAPLTAYCFMTGFIDAVCFSAIFVWCAFQTGNSVQLALALARLFNGLHDYSFHLADRQALCSVLTFIFGAFIGRLGDKIGCKTRLWMALGTFIQTLFTMAAAIAIWKSGQPSFADARSNPAWSNTLSFVCIGFMSASMGLQGIMGKRLNTQFTTTVVLTTTWCELMTEPQLFRFRRLVIARDHKVMAILFLFIGGFSGRAILDKIGSAGTLGIGTAVRLLISLWWLFVPAKKVSKS